MKYYARYDSGKLIAIGTDCGGTELSEQEYINLLSEIRSKAALTEQLYSGNIGIEDVPEEWRAEIQERVDALISMYGPIDPEDISDSEALAIILGGEA